MAIYHFSAKVISRASGSSAVAAAAYRSASRLRDERIDRHHDFTNKAGVVHSEVMLPGGAPDHLSERERLWNTVEASEKRIDAQLAREIEFAIPRELNRTEGVRLAREFVQREFVDRGMIADLNVHWDIGADGMAKPHAHVMLTMREVSEDGFGAKVRDWNRTELLSHWRGAWAEHTNRRLAELDIDARVDHRSLEAQGIGLEPQHKIGPAASRMKAQGLASERLEEHHATARTNGEKIIADPRIALDGITRTQATFTTRDLAMFVHRHSADKEQFDRAMSAVRECPKLVALGKDGRGEQRFTSSEIIATEQRLERATEKLEAERRHGLREQHRKLALARAEMRGLTLSSEQRSAFEHVTRGQGLGVVIGYAGTGKSAMLGVAREAWESAGYSVRGAALSGIAAENLQSGSGIASRTLASMEHQWSEGRELLARNDVLVIDEAGMIGTRQMERVIGEAQKRGAKVVLVGDPEQLQAIEAGAAFRSIAERHGSVEITDIRRQRQDWQRDATRYLATQRTGEAITAYERHGNIHPADTREQARSELVDRWDRERASAPGTSRIILTHTNDEVQALNALARDRMRERGDLGTDVTITTERGERAFASGDRLLFLRNERSLGVKNGSLGTIEHASLARLSVLLDDGRSVAFDVKDYNQIDHGYATTIHKAQGVTVDQVHVLATRGLDRHAAYVALSRHRDNVDLHYGREDFADQGNLVRTLSRERGKDMASDYRGNPPSLEVSPPAAAPLPDKARRQDQPDLAAAVTRHGQIVKAMQFYRSVGEPVTPEQRGELAASRTALDAVRPHAALDLETAMAADRRHINDAAAGRTASVIRAMQLEDEMRSDPQLRADVFVQRWRALDRSRRGALEYQETSKAGRIADRMAGMAKSLQRDPQVESILRGRRAQLGLPSHDGADVGRSLSSMADHWRARGRGLGL